MRSTLVIARSLIIKVKLRFKKVKRLITLHYTTRDVLLYKAHIDESPGDYTISEFNSISFNNIIKARIYI